jgi:tetratricopeptide (TPR) repeat protein
MDTGGVPAADKFQKAHELLLRADQARDAGQKRDAIERYRVALEAYVELRDQYPDWQPGVTRFRAGYCDGQIEALLREVTATEAAEAKAAAVAAGAESAADVAGRAKQLLAKGDAEGAKAALLEALRSSPDDARIRLLIGVVHCQAGEYEKAMYIVQPLLDENETNAAARVVLGAAYMGLNRPQDARTEIEKALMTAPDLREAHYDLAQILAACDPPAVEGARLQYRRAVELGEEPDPDLAQRLGEPAGAPAAPTPPDPGTSVP